MEDEEHPNDLCFDLTVIDLDFHPLKDLVAVGLISGRVQIFQYAVNENQNRGLFQYHAGSCRAVLFGPDGQYLYTGGGGGSIGVIDVDTNKLVHKKKVHKHSIYSLACKNGLLSSGDDNGIVKVWDLRQQACIHTFDHNSDFISSLQFAPETMELLSTSGDGTLAIMDLRKGKLTAQSDVMDDELLSLAIIKYGKRVICGTQEGVLDIFTWGQWDEISDRFPGHPNSVEAVLKIDEDTICTGSSDGLIRVCKIQPNDFLGVIGDHEDFPIESMKFSRDRCLLGSCSHDNTVKFWNVRYLFEDDEDEDNGVDVDQSSDNKTGTIMDAEMADREADTATQDESRTTKTVTSPQRQGLPSAPSAAVQSIQQQIRKQEKQQQQQTQKQRGKRKRSKRSFYSGLT